MYCEKCGKQINDDSKFCMYCGAAVQKTEPEGKVCPDCGKEFEENMVFCDQCGRKLCAKGNVKKETGTKGGLVGFKNDEKGSSVSGVRNHTKLYEFHMMSKYDGEPTVGIAKATGTLKIYDDCIEFKKTFGNALGGAFGAVGLLVAQKKATKDGDTETYTYNSIRDVWKGAYAGLMPTIVIQFNSGDIISFCGAALGRSIDQAVETIRRLK